MSLNPEQSRAVQHRGSGLLVLAGAGTGKTRVITHRVADLIEDGVDPKRIVTVTFTNKAAKEMRGRLEKMGVKEGAWIGTFHATGLRILRMYAEELGYDKRFTIYDSDAQETIVKSRLAIVPIRGADTFSPRVILSFIEKAKGAGFTPDEIGQTEVPPLMQKLVGEVFRLYQIALKKANAMDFADLLVNTNILLRRGERSKAAWLLKQFQYVLVDEFQDTNKIQMDMVDLLATNGEICVVGDDDQAIYGWRGADPKGMFDFSKRPGVELVRLEENYRSTTAILDCANAIITRNASRLGKILWTEKDGDPVRVVELRDERKEAEYVASRISGPHWKDYAVLYRTHAQSRPFEQSFRRHGIPYTIVGGLRFYDRAEIKDMMAYFRLAVNPKSDVDLLRIANRPARGAGAKKIGTLKTAAEDQGITLFEALKTAKDPKLTALYDVLVSLQKATHAASLFDFYTHVLRKTGYRDALVKTSKESGSTAQREKAQTRIANVDELASDIETFERDHPDATVMQYLEHVALVSSADKETGPVVSLMTIHAAKGLEFPHVFAVGFEENLLPHLNSIRAYEKDRDVSHIEEECRLAYVAVTRAMKRLDITYASARMLAGRSKLVRPSRFLSALPDKKIERLNLIL